MACEWLDRVYLVGPIWIPIFASGTRQLLQALCHCYTGLFAKGATTQPTTGAQAQYRQAYWTLYLCQVLDQHLSSMGIWMVRALPVLAGTARLV